MTYPAPPQALHTAAPRRAADLWESHLDRLHRLYLRDGLADVSRCHPRVRHVRSLAGGRFVGVRDKAGPVDYVGRIGTMAMCADAKCTRSARLPFRGVPRHQAQQLQRYTDAGAVAILLVWSGAPYVIPWAAICDRYWAPGTASCLIADDGIPFGPRGWIDAI